MKNDYLGFILGTSKMLLQKRLNQISREVVFENC
jgi:hypothetical protein